MNETSRPGPPLPRDCRLHPLNTLPDHRGDLTEMFREEWFESPPSRHWHVMRAGANALTGIRVYARDWLYLCLLDGGMFVSLTDLRPTSAGRTGSAQVTLSDASRQALVIAPGVAHGLYFSQAASYLLGRVEGADPAERLLCAWDSPDLGIAWPFAVPDLAASDREGSSFAEFKAGFLTVLEGQRHD